MAHDVCCLDHRVRYRLLHSISVFGGLFMLEVPLREVTGVNSFPCDVYLWMAYLFVPLFATPLIAGTRFAWSL